MRIALVALLALIVVSSALALTVGPLTISQFNAASEDPVFYNEMGYMLAQEGDLPGAISAFEKAIQLDPSYENARKNLAVAAFRAERYSLAIEHLRVLVSQHDTAQYEFDLAQNLVHQARFVETDLDPAVSELQEAIGHFERAHELEPGYPHALQNAALVRTILG